MKRAQGIGINIVIIAAIALLVLVLIAVIVMGSGGDIRESLDACPVQGGECLTSSPGTEYVVIDGICDMGTCYAYS
jgi:hypothetical protein